MIEPEKLNNMKHGDAKWQAERRLCDAALNACVIRLRSHVRNGSFESACQASEDIAQAVDEMVQLAGVQK